MDEKNAIRQIIFDYLETYFVEKNFTKTLSFVTDDITGFCLGDEEMILCRNDLHSFLHENIQLIKDIDFKIVYDQIYEQFYSEDVAAASIALHLEFLDEGIPTRIKLMHSFVLKKQYDSWYICKVHCSRPQMFYDSQRIYPVRYAESALLQLHVDINEKEAKLISQSIPGGIMGVYNEADYPLYFINESMLCYLGYHYEEFMDVTGGKILGCVHQDDRQVVTKQMETFLKKGNEFEIRCRLIKKNGEFIWVSHRGRKGRLDSGQEVIINIFIDITEIIELQQDLQLKSKALNSTNNALINLTNNVAGGVFTLNLDDNFSILYANSYFYRMFGYTQSQMIRRNKHQLLSLILPSDMKRVRNTIKNTFSSKRPSFDLEVRGVKSYGHEIWILIRGCFLRIGEEIEIHCVVLDITDRKRMEYALALSEERFRIALQKTSYIIFDYNIFKDRITHSSIPASNNKLANKNNALQKLGLLEGELLSEYKDDFYKAFIQIRSGADRVEYILKLRQKDHSFKWNKLSMTSISDADGNAIRAIGMIEDITSQKEMEMGYRREEQYRQAFLANAMASYIINFTENSFESYQVDSPLCTVPIESDTYDFYIQQNAKLKVYGEDREQYLNKLSLTSIMTSYQQGILETEVECRCVKPPSSLIWTLTRLRIVTDNESQDLKGFMYVVDIDVKKREEILLTYKAERDSLTELYHKGVAETRIKELLNSEKVIGSSVFFILDIDHFKEINDVYGHPFGDKVLKDAATGICSLLRQGSIVGRLGGDEFCIFFRKDNLTYENITLLAEKICAMFKALSPQTGEVTITCSIGISVCLGGEKEFEMLYQEADNALYYVKKNGRNGYSFYNEKNKQ